MIGKRASSVYQANREGGHEVNREAVPGKEKNRKRFPSRRGSWGNMNKTQKKILFITVILMITLAGFGTKVPNKSFSLYGLELPQSSIGREILILKYSIMTVLFSVGVVLFAISGNQKRAKGIAAIGLSTILYEVFVDNFIVTSIFISFIIYKLKCFLGGPVSSEGEQFYATILGDKHALFYVLLRSASLVTFFTCIGIGLLKLKKWAWYLIFILIFRGLFNCGMFLIYKIKAIYEMFVSTNAISGLDIYVIGVLLLFVLFVTAFFYLIRPEIRKQFK